MHSTTAAYDNLTVYYQTEVLYYCLTTGTTQHNTPSLFCECSQPCSDLDAEQMMIEVEVAETDHPSMM
jgi:hypothetical protein